ncbi:hypothetical protein ACFQS3_19470 [Glycomyces mayteni]|uniref:Uncharacterized protein n=1 Tax=Glycomyces mayteni TaxID=543887 RepID=A0ABW2DE37_9ACTN|nr:hypothetical protein GCM10025732_03830 [Glycomyces mayteni]
MRFPLLLLACLTAVLLYGALAGVGDGAPVEADCFHVDPTGDIGTCADAPEPALTSALTAANWAWWGPAAAPVVLGALAVWTWWRIKSTAASRAPRRP